MLSLVVNMILLRSEGAFAVESLPDTTAVVSVHRMYFPVNSSLLSDDYLTNRNDAAVLADYIGGLDFERIDSVLVTAYASPEGPYQRNMKLSQERSTAFEALVPRYFSSLGG